MFNNERVSILVKINKVLSKLECWVMKELDNKRNNVSGFQRFGLSKHKISWIEYIVIQFSVWYLVCIYLWSSIVDLWFVFGYTIINGLERIWFIAQE